MNQPPSFLSPFVDCMCCTAFQEEEKLAGKGAPLLPRFGLLETRISASLDAIVDFDLSV